MAAKDTTVTARKLAEEVSRRLGKPVNAKRVRQWVRDHLPAFDDEGYTAHNYTPAQRAAILKGMTKAAAQPRSKAATRGRAKPAAKPQPTETPSAE